MSISLRKGRRACLVQDNRAPLLVPSSTEASLHFLLFVVLVEMYPFQTCGMRRVNKEQKGYVGDGQEGEI